jgi:hypothetical protein
MHLRHIQPRSVDWYDATLEEEERKFRLSPEEKTKLRLLGEPEPIQLAPLIHSATIVPTRSLL